MQRKIFQILFVISCWLLTGLTVLAQSTAEELIARGKEQLDQKQYLEAKESFEAAVKADPRSPEAYFYRGKVQLDRDEADHDFTKAIELKPDYAQAYYERGLNRDLDNRPKDAMRDYNRAIELNPSLVSAYMTRAVLYMLDNKYPLAIADYTKVIELEPRGDGYYVRGTAYLDSGHYAEAARDLTRAIEIEPAYYWGWKQRAKAYRHLKRYKLAQADEQKAAEIGPPK